MLPWIFVILLICAAYPWACRLLPDESDEWLPLLLTLALSTGALSLLMFWEALLGIRLSLWGVTIPYLLLMLPPWMRVQSLMLRFPRPPLARFALLILLLISAGILFNTMYWPFSREDTLGIYAHFGAYLSEQGALAPLLGPLTVHEAYPMLIPLLYSFAYLAAGWEHQFLAGLFPALLSLGCLASVFTLGKMLHSALAGWIGAVLLGVMPTFASWASAGYVDLPMAFFYSLAAIFAWRLWQRGNWRDALLSGVMLGLAAWTKNAALWGVLLLAAWLLWGIIGRRINWRLAALALIACAGVAAPWYLRNLIEAHLILPPTAWTDQAQQTLETLLILVTRPQNYSLSGLLILVSIISAVVEVLRRRLNAPELILLLGWTLPFFGIWWLFASYDPRFILLFLPLWCTLAGLQLAKVWVQIPQNWQPRLTIPIAGIVLILGLLATWESVEFKGEVLRNPIMSVEERQAIVYKERQPRLYRELFREE